VHVADRLAHHPDAADPRAPALRLNFEYLEKNKRGKNWNSWREVCGNAIAQGNSK